MTKRDFVKRRGGALPAPLSVRLWTKVQIGPDCWEWLGARNSDGYPVLWDGARLTYAYRIAYEMIVGKVPEGMELDHLCSNRWCVNPGHLEPVSHLVNVRRAFARKRKEAAA